MMTADVRFSLVVISVMLALAPAGVRAQGAEAETLFREGKRLLKDGDTAGACDKFEASERLEPTAGTELNLADCREKLGQLATAWAMFVKAAATAKHSDTDGKREAEAKKRAAALEPRLVHLRVLVGEDHPEGLVIKRNGAAVDPELWNQRVPVDPGDYVIAAEAPGYEPWQTNVTVRGKDKKVDVPPLDKSSKPQGGDTTVTKQVHKAKDNDDGEGEKPAPPPPPSGMTGKRKLGIAVAGIGLAALGGAIAFAEVGQTRESQANTLCPTVLCNSARGVQLNSEARRDALIGDIGFGVAGALIVTGGALIVLGGAKAPVEVSFGASPRGAGLALGGTW